MFLCSPSVSGTTPQPQCVYYLPLRLWVVSDGTNIRPRRSRHYPLRASETPPAAPAVFLGVCRARAGGSMSRSSSLLLPLFSSASQKNLVKNDASDWVKAKASGSPRRALTKYESSCSNEGGSSGQKTGQRPEIAAHCGRQASRQFWRWHWLPSGGAAQAPANVTNTNLSNRCYRHRTSYMPLARIASLLVPLARSRLRLSLDVCRVRNSDCKIWDRSFPSLSGSHLIGATMLKKDEARRTENKVSEIFFIGIQYRQKLMGPNTWALVVELLQRMTNVTMIALFSRKRSRFSQGSSGLRAILIGFPSSSANDC